MNNNLQPWRKPFMVILTIITIICIFVGLGYNIFRFSNATLERFFHFTGNGRSDYSYANDTLVFDDSLKDISIDCDIADISIKYGDKLTVAYDYPDNSIPEIKLDKNKLVVTQKNNNIFNSTGLKGIKCKLELTLPKNAEISSAVFNVDMGNIEFDDFSCASLTCTTAMGNIELDNIKAAEFTLDSNMGNIEISDIDCTNVDADCDMGNIEIYGKAKTIKADCSMGNITIKTSNDDAVIDADCDMGSCTVNGVNLK